MLGLKLRSEFLGRRLKGTAIELSNENKTGATQVPAAGFLEITYPATDVLEAIEAVGPAHGHPVVLIGERGLGKSHVLATLHHALSDPAATASWLAAWAERLARPKLAAMPLRKGMHVISESLHRQSFKFLWDLILQRHPHGDFIRGKWAGMGEKRTDVLPAALVLELLQRQPTALLLDEFQTWFDGLTNTKQYPWRTWAFNFIQILSEIAEQHPELLVLVLSVRNGESDAYQQVHRVNPKLVDFKGPDAQRDRRRLLLHRLFENRLQIPPTDIERTIAVHVGEMLRLGDVPPPDHERRTREMVECWPFATHLMELLEDQVLVATSAQETRDLIRILADLYRRRGESAPVLTAADFRIDDEQSGINALLDSVANEQHSALRERALRNLNTANEAGPIRAQAWPHLAEVVSALWLRSLAQPPHGGATRAQLQLDITRDKAIDDNAFQVELAAIADQSFNIHPEAGRLVFRVDENPQARLMAHARNDRLFADRSDEAYLAREIRWVVGGGDGVANANRVVVLPADWTTKPWAGMAEADLPERWDERLPLVVLPESPDKLEAQLGRWLKEHVRDRRNTVRFLLPKAGTASVYNDRDLVILARATMKAAEWRAENPEYTRLHAKYQGELRRLLAQRFDRFAILRAWSFQEPARCTFHVAPPGTASLAIPDAISDTVRQSLFVQEDLDAFVTDAAGRNESVDKLLRELREPRPNGAECIAWLGEVAMKERIVRLCASGAIAINLRGSQYLQRAPGEDPESAWRRMRGQLGTGRHLEETYVLLPQAVPHAQGPEAQPPIPGVTPIPAAPTQPQPAGGIAPTAPLPPAALVTHEAPATSALNLLARVEGWGVGPASVVRQVTIKIDALRGADLQRLLRNLPPDINYALGLQREDRG